MMKFYSRLVILECLGVRAILPRSGFRIEPYLSKKCSSDINPYNAKMGSGDVKGLTNSHVVSIIKSVQEFGFEECEVKSLINNQPELMKKPFNSWQNIIELLLQADFDKNEIVNILEKWPIILNFNKNDLQNKLIVWMELGVSNDLVRNILTTHPDLLNVDNVYLKKRIKQYQLYFESKNRVGKLILLAPNTLEESWTIMREKLNYLNDLCTDNSDIAASGVLAHTLLHIKARHEFLIRAGVYKRPQKDFIKKLNNNPKLEKIVNTTDEEFVSKIAGLSLFEYNVFLEMYEEELKDVISEGEIDSDDETIMYKLNYKKNI